MTASAASRWAQALEEWAIPEPILAGAPESPWVLPPALFKVDVETIAPDTPSRRMARAGLGAGGTVLDVGCGGGAASVALGDLATKITGVDEALGMLANFADACLSRDIAHAEIQGRWPDIADRVEPADVVVCHHVAYNVTDIEPFLIALSDHARALVVVELPDHHPLSALNPLWERFWGLRRPSEPTAGLFVEIVAELGYEPIEQRFERRARGQGPDRAEAVAFVRRRLCLGADRDPEIDLALGDAWPPAVTTVVSVAWSPHPTKVG